MSSPRGRAFCFDLSEGRFPTRCRGEEGNKMNYVTGGAIRTLRERKGLTQRELAEQLKVSDKTVSKWETGRGLPDVALLAELSAALGVSVAELLAGECAENRNRACDLRKTVFYVCPVCGNIITSVGGGVVCCHGVTLPELVAEECTGHELQVELMDGDYYVSVEHEMTKEHYISFFAYVTMERVELCKLYPEQAAECRFRKKWGGFLYAYCNRHGLVRVRV